VDYFLEYLQRELGRTPRLSEYLQLAYWGEDAPRNMRELQDSYPEDAADVQDLLDEGLLKEGRRSK
jgi:hypothetical protein